MILHTWCGACDAQHGPDARECPDCAGPVNAYGVADVPASGDGVMVDLIRRLPPSTEVLGVYEVEVDDDGN